MGTPENEGVSGDIYENKGVEKLRRESPEMLMKNKQVICIPEIFMKRQALNLFKGTNTPRQELY